ncbi:MAG: hypothetical protein JWQ73_2077 [Variovorax sp.]|jgi:hypothetical protein|nr:hypothetical protein [Variovorax sp.]
MNNSTRNGNNPVVASNTSWSPEEAACIRLCVDMVHGVDLRDYERTIATFTSDALLVAPGKQVNGHEGLRSFLSARPVDILTRHCCSNFRIDFHDARSASGSCYVVCFKAKMVDGADLPVQTPAPTVGEYHDQFVLTTDGWRIHRREIRLLFAPL